MGEVDGPELAPTAFDELFRAQAGSTLLLELWSRAWGEDYPHEVEPFSPCSWSLLSSLVDALRLPPGATLVDLGCGRGGPGLWLARAMNARLVGIDWSAAAVELAEGRAPGWLPNGRYEMRTGTFTETGLPDGAADAVVSVDALALAPDPAAALAEVRRITAPGGRVAFTASEAAGGDPADRVWATLLNESGLALESAAELAGTTDALRRLYDLTGTHAAELREDLGATPTDHLLREAELVGPELESLTWIVYVARRSV
ncbi:MAG TPA: methyltransferase domain-containing protein [Thermoleophilaceae bacterium]|nr:methyltransferase domain-containing protein [Thermoleophilaceae bacterium]